MKNNKVLFIISSHGKMGDTDEKTGWWISEASHPWKILHQAGYEVDFASPAGGPTPMTGEDPKDVINKEFLENTEIQRKLQNTLRPDEVNIDNYGAIHYVGGHGAVWDFPDNTELAKLTAKLWEQGKIVSAICHGVAGLLNVKLRGGDLLIKNRNLTSFTDMEEKLIHKCDIVPYLLQCELMLKGAIFHITKPWGDNVQVHERLITGQNPQSGLSLGKALVSMLQHLNM
ncbi:MAG: type 1 glutamine amidotransferase domain-containing protein [Bacteroidales bacterium]